MFDAEFAKYLTTLGIGGAIAGLIFMFYRKDMKQFTELWQITSGQLMDVIKENTASNTELITLIKSAKEPVITKAEVEALIVKHTEALKTKRHGAS